MQIVCAHIEGLGKIDGSGQSSGYLFTTVLPDGFDQTLDGYDWRQVMPEGPRPGTTRVEPFEPRFRFAPFGLEFSAGRNQDFLPELLLYKQTQATTTLAEDVIVGETSFDVGSGSGLSAGDVIYVGGETIKIVSISGNTLTVTGQRGWYGSDEAPHQSGASVYTRPPFFEGRRVVLYTYDTGDGASFSSSRVARMRGVIDGTITMDKATLKVPITQMLAPLSKSKLNRDPAVDESYNLQKATFNDDSPQYAGESVLDGIIRVRSNVRKADDNVDSQFFDIDGKLYRGPGLTRLQPNGRLSRGANDSWSTLEPANIDRPPIELFVAGARLGVDSTGQLTSSASALDDMPATFTVGGTSFSLDAQQRAAYVHHPLAIACGMLFSTPSLTQTPEEFDVFQGPNFGADLGFLFSDTAIARAHALITDAVGVGQSIDQLVLGAGGDAFEFLRLIQRKLLHPYDYKVGVDKNGRLNFYRSQLPDVGSYGAARDNQISPLSGTDVAYVVDNGQGSTTDIIEATLGGTDYIEGRTITLRADTGQPDRPYILNGGADAELDLSTIDSQTGVNRAVEIVTSRALLQHYASKRLRVSVEDWSKAGKDYGLGEYVTLDDIRINDAWLTDKNGNRVSQISSDVQWVGQIISRTPVDGFSGFELEVIFTSNDIVRYRAPSGRVASYDSTTFTITLDADIFHPDGDGAQFTGGDQIDIVGEDGAVIDSGTVSTVTDDTLTMTAAFSTTDPVNGDYIRLTNFDGYDNDKVDTYTDRVYVYLADTAATLGTADEDADIYGI